MRLVPLALAGCDLHSLVGSAAHLDVALHWLSTLSPGSAAPWLLLALAFGAGFLLRESARGLVALLAVGALLGDTLATHAHALTDGFGSVGWDAAVPLALLAGFVLPAVFVGAWWALRDVARVRGRSSRLRPLSERPQKFAWSPVPAPLLAGWSDRGPPPTAALATV